MSRSLTRLALLACLLALPASRAFAQTPAAPDSAGKRWSSFLPLMGDLATSRGIQLPLPFGTGAVYYHLSRDIEVSDVRVGRNGATPASVSRFVQIKSNSNVENLNFKLDAWILPFVNLYLIGGYIWNKSETTLDVSLPPLLPGGPDRQKRMTVPTELEGSVGGVGMTLAGGYGPYFMAYDVNAAQADLGFDDRFKAVVTSIRGGWFGTAGARPVRAWVNVTDWNTFATATGTVADPDGGTLSFEVDQGPAYRYTYGAGGQTSLTPHIDLALDAGTDAHGGWYLAVVPVFRF